MERPSTWKVVTLGVALTGLGVAGAGAAVASGPAVEPAGIEVAQTAVHADLAPMNFIAMDDDWTDTYHDDDSYQSDDWTDTYWDD